MPAIEAASRGQTSVYAVDPLQDVRWLQLTAQHPNASVFHSRGWLRALRITYGYEPVAFTTCAPVEPLTNALVFCVVRSWLTGDRLVSLPFSDHCEPLVASSEEFRALTAFVEGMRQVQGWKYVEMRIADPARPCDGTFSRSTTYCLHRLDLRPELNRLYRGLHKDCIQRKIRRAEREQLSYEVGADKPLIDRLYRLLQSTRARHRLPPQPIEWFRNLVACMGSNACIRIASKAGKPVAGILTLEHGKKCFYKYGGADARFHNLGGTAMLFWELIKEAKEAGMEWLDFGRSDLDNPGLITFKARWSADSSILATWRAPVLVAAPDREGMKLRCMKQVFARMPDSLLTLAGRLLYRHIG